MNEIQNWPNTESERQNSINHLAQTYHGGDVESAKKYIDYVVSTHGPEQVIRAGPLGVIYGKAGKLQKPII